MSKVERLGERLDELSHGGNRNDLTTEEANMVRYFWIQLHWTPAEAEENYMIEKRREILLEKGRMTTEEQAEDMRLSTRETQLAHDIAMKRVIANDAMRDRVWPELAPRVLRYWKLREKPLQELTDAEAEEWKGLLEWFSKLQREILEGVKQHWANQT